MEGVIRRISPSMGVGEAHGKWSGEARLDGGADPSIAVPAGLLDLWSETVATWCRAKWASAQVPMVLLLLEFSNIISQGHPQWRQTAIPAFSNFLPTLLAGWRPLFVLFVFS